jgi:hypothetical protein
VATYRAFAASSPPTAGTTDNGAYSLGVEFTVSTACTLTQILWWQPSTNNSTDQSRTVRCFSTTNGTAGTALGSAQTQAPSGTGWQTITLATPVALAVGTRYVAVVYHPQNRYASTSGYFISGGAGVDGVTNGPLVIPNAANASPGNGRFFSGTGITYPNSTFNGSNYWIDVTVDDGASASLPLPDLHMAPRR